MCNEITNFEFTLDIEHTPLNIERIKSTKAQNKAHLKGFLFTLNGVSLADKQYWLCEKRGTCKARMTTSSGGAVLIPSLFTEIISSHTHAPGPARSQMLQGHQLWKDRKSAFGDETRTILTQGLVGLNKSSIVAILTLSLVKRTICRHKSFVEENGISHNSAAKLQVPHRHRFTIKKETYLIYDSEFGDSNSILIFCAPKILSLMGESQIWHADAGFHPGKNFCVPRLSLSSLTRAKNIQFVLFLFEHLSIYAISFENFAPGGASHTPG